ncbi:ras-related protein Rab-24 isoform X2 [Aplysia californica]|uniref:Ras-related protein Rab-24 isoform X2 n=1 Tax=Aplysia californica TaxID=6500 RepID=A0ABM0JNX6_APLCA|nr:ras-related protein Rab-24 isoform X2 [Aplysia californica]
MSGGKVDIKVVLLGKAYAGKTSLVERFIHNRFVGDTVPYQNTIGAAFGAKTVTIDNKNVIIGIWDTAGSERYEAMSRIYYRGARAAIVCYDLTDKSSFDRARFWIGELQKHEENCQIYLCGTKYDLVEAEPALRKIDERETRALAIDVRGEVYETSSKTGKDIERIFRKIATDYLATKKEPMTEENPDLVRLRKASKSKKLCAGCKS